ncbi:MAG: LysR family transcriptional regulator [Gammaproteobacteria bacterium]|nr:LysR family transcriptional regulator [Gammaproteobacteria bacterium]
MHHIELRHLRTVAALRGASTLVEAAERVYLTQSALSHQLKDLEERLGCTLFIRKTRPMRFTSAGKRLLQLADEVLPLVQTASLDLARLAGGHSGRLHMSIECHSCFEWLLPAINAYREDWPEVELDISGGFHFQPLPALLRGDLDLVVTADPIEEPGLAYLPLFGYEAQMALAADHRLTEKEWIDPGDVADETLITYPIDRSRQDIFTRFLDPAGIEPARVRTAELTPMMVQLVASGRGVCCLPNWALHEYIERDYVVARSLGEEGIWPNLYAAVRTEQRDAPYIAAFVALAKDTCYQNLVGIGPTDSELEEADTENG